jgi:hypothetical protein
MIKYLKMVKMLFDFGEDFVIEGDVEVKMLMDSLKKGLSFVEVNDGTIINLKQVKAITEV